MGNDTSRRVDGLPETEADRRFFDERESGYTGPLDQDGHRVPADDLGAQILARMQQASVSVDEP